MFPNRVPSEHANAPQQLGATPAWRGRPVGSEARLGLACRAMRAQCAGSVPCLAAATGLEG